LYPAPSAAITGTAGQVVGFDANGKPAAQSASSLSGAVGPQGPAGPQGPKGDKGDKGDPGDLSSFTGILPIANGGTGNADGYIRTGQVTGLAAGIYATAEGTDTNASGPISHTEGFATRAAKDDAHAEGLSTEALAIASHAEGKCTISDNYASHASGKYNKAMATGAADNNTNGDAMVIGNGVGQYDWRSNCFRVTYAGEVYGLSAFHSTGADYAEYFEWADGNPEGEDRVGRFVTLEGNKIRIAQPGEYVLGIVSGQPCIIGNADEDWLGRWVHDEFGRFLKEDVDTPVTRMRPVLDGEGYPTGKMEEVETGEIIHGWRFRANPDYDASQPYVERRDRPEWSAVGMLGVLSVRDGGSCQVNGFCEVGSDGTAVPAGGETPGKSWRVIARTSPGTVRAVFR